jgi:hypothetical protein
MKNNKQQTAVEYLYNEMYKIIEFYAGHEQLSKCMILRKQANEMDKKQAQEYAAFCVACDRKELPLLEFDGWVKLERGEQ